jgi:hypothetical protein
MYARHLAERLEQRSQIALGRLKIHVAHKKTFHVASPGIFVAPLARARSDADPLVKNTRLRIG